VEARVASGSATATKGGPSSVPIRGPDCTPFDILGFVEEWDLGRTVGWNNGVTMVWVVEAEPGAKPHRTGDIGFHHYAFELDSSEAVDELGDFLNREGATIVDPPADYPSYGEGYRAVFFLDPDGLKLEGMYFREKVKRGGRPPEAK
jgi:catechol 2,3-dioxygenase-like lactoylglutathione lyase family enzyme